MAKKMLLLTVEEQRCVLGPLRAGAPFLFATSGVFRRSASRLVCVVPTCKLLDFRVGFISNP